jgi:anion-transporting  ArsA/GET3 family ATPase
MTKVRPSAVLSRRLLLFTGKGGVGKSTVVAGLALQAARAGRRPLIVELGHRASMEAMFRAGAIGHEPRSVGRGVWALNLSFDHLLADYMEEHVRIRRLVDAVLRNNALQRFFQSAPAIAEIATLNKLSALERAREPDGGPTWDPVLVDLDATGHALMLLDLPRVMDGLVGDGPLRRLVDGFSDLLTDPMRTVLCLVTLPRELPATETRELHARLIREHEVPLGVLFVNQVPQIPLGEAHLRWMDELEQRARRSDDRELLEEIEVTRRSIRTWNAARAQITVLKDKIDLPLVELPMVADAHFDLEVIDRLGRLAVEALTGGGRR